MTLKAIQYTRGSLSVLDQLRLPHESIYVCISNSEDAFNAIVRMVVRGAPAIAIVAALGLAVELNNVPPTLCSAEAVKNFIFEKLEYLLQSRPTAVNLADAVTKLKGITAEPSISGKTIIEKYIQAAERMLADDVKDNRSIGNHGAQFILDNDSEKSVAVLTHCNTGSLATAGYGTALGIIRALYSRDALQHAYCTETRPYNQGSRLTAYELTQDFPEGMSTLITDSMAASLMQQRKISAVIVGADRVARNGDTANKIGTYQLAIVARYHGVKFVVAAPTTSIDMNTMSGSDITIEQRPSSEVLVVRGPVVKDVKSMTVDKTRIETILPGVAHGIGVFNPGFDVTPKDLIDVIVTEKGVAVKNHENQFELAELFG
ncbi:hypothetical protein EDC01DRAFT_618784 [Geopyxis carbonaria]|nr:hypothetical protein EDC01DRAFT_618784 [Geopyxis carbonaria]